MIDINELRKNPGKFKEGTRNKGYNPSVVGEVLELDEKRRELIPQVEELRAERNIISKEPTDENIRRGRQIKKDLKELEPKLREVEEKLNEKLLQIPNPAADDVPIGEDESGNVVLRKWGEPTKFNFEPKDHLKLGERLDIIDTERAAKVSGSRFGYLKGDAVLLEFALVQFAMEKLTGEGFEPVIPPVLIKESSMRGMGYLEHKGKDDMFIIPEKGEREDYVLVGTSEQSIGPIHLDEVLSKEKLPLRYVGFSHCFRREAGSYGKDTRGILRVHQFDKVEMFSFIEPERGDEELNYFLELEEWFYQKLEIPYQVVQMCTGDLGAPAAKKYDLEAWIPTQGKYREITSTSTTTNFQARRLNIKYSENGKTDYVYMLNGTAFAIGRTLIAILENYQQADGSIRVPRVLQKYVGRKLITPSNN